MRRIFLLLLLLGLPLLEIAGFVVVGGEIGVLPTIALILATGIAGSIALRVQGSGILQRVRADLEAGRNPSRDVAHGLMVLAAGILLILPGFFTDLFGILLFLPPVRDLAWRYLRRGLIAGATFQTTRGFDFRRQPGKTRSPTIDLDDDEYSSSQDSPWRPIDRK